MTTREAKEILLLYRPDSRDAEDPQVIEAIKAAGEDPELGRWFAQHCEFQKTMRAKFRNLEVPARLRAGLLVPPNVIRPQVWWRTPRVLAVAAALVLCLGLVALWLRPRPPDRLANFEERMVSTALREYRMDIVTNSMPQVRQYLAQQGGPSDYEIPPGLSRLELTGGGILRWRRNPVSMVCFNRGDNEMLFLFVIDRSRLRNPPPPTPQIGSLHDLTTASWSKGGKTYVLAGPQEPGFARKYL